VIELTFAKLQVCALRLLFRGVALQVISLGTRMNALHLLLCLLLLVTFSEAVFKQRKPMDRDKLEHIGESTRPTSWAHLQGVHFDEAKAAVLKDRPDLRVVKVSKVRPDVEKSPALNVLHEFGHCTCRTQL
jgi:hypothetical protein